MGNEVRLLVWRPTAELMGAVMWVMGRVHSPERGYDDAGGLSAIDDEFPAGNE